MENRNYESRNARLYFVSGEAYAREIKNYARLHDLCYRPGIIGRAPLAALPDWPGDWEERTLLALALYASALHTTPPFLDQLVLDIRSLCNKNGYRGELIDENNISEQVFPSNSWLLRGLIEYYKLTGKQFVMKWINEILDNLFIPMFSHLDNYPRNKEDIKSEYLGEAAGTINGRYRKWRLSSDVGCIFIPVDGLTCAYELTGRADLLPLIEKIINLFPFENMIENRLQTHATLTFMRGVLRLYRLKGQERLLSMAVASFDIYKKYGMTCCWETLTGL